MVQAEGALMDGKRDEVETVRFAGSKCHMEFRLSLNGSFGGKESGRSGP